MRYFPTGNALTSGTFGVTLYFPNAQANWVYSVFLGALMDLQDVNQWMTQGETTRDEAVQIFSDIFDRIEPMLFTIGQVILHAAPTMADSAWLPCDGTLYDSSDEPELYAAIGTLYNTGGEASGYFRVPDLRGRVVAGVNDGLSRLPTFADDLGGTGGESEHTLSSTEMPSHAHTTGNSLTGAAVVPGEGPVLMPNPLPAYTGNAGGDGAHNNVQPTMALYYYILSRV